MGYGYSKVQIKNETEKSWKVELLCCHQYNVHTHDGNRTHWVDSTVQSHSQVEYILHKPSKVHIQFVSSGDGQNAQLRYNYLENFPESRQIILRIRPLDRKSAELYQDGKGRRDTCGHPDREGDLREEEERRKERLKREQELERQIQLERDEKKRRLLEIENKLERHIQVDVPARKQQILLQEAFKCPSSSITDDEDTSAGKIYDKIVASQPAYKKFEESKSLQNYTISDRSGYLVNFILADYCHANNISPSFHDEVLSITAYNEVRLTEKLIILNALSESVHNFTMFDEVEELEDSIGVHNLDSRFDLFLRLLSVTTNTDVEVATKILVHCVKLLPSRYRRPPCELTIKEKDHLSLLISNRIWSPMSALKLLSFTDIGDRADMLRKALIYHIEDTSLLQETHFPCPPPAHQVCLSSPTCTAEDVEKLINLVQSKREKERIRKKEQKRQEWTLFFWRKNKAQKEGTTGATILPECRNELSFDKFADIIVALSEAMTSHEKADMNENQLRLLIETLVCKSSDNLTTIDREERSVVVAMVAAIQALLVHAVDIVVSNETYVTTDVEEWQEFYSGLGLSSCGAGAKHTPCNSVPSHIVYGTPSQFNDIDRISRPVSKFTCLIIGCSEPHISFSTGPSSQERDVDTVQFSHLLPQYKCCYNLMNGTKFNNQDQDMTNIMEVVDRIIDSEEDRPFHQLLEEIEYSTTMSPEMHKEIVDVIEEIARTLEGTKYAKSDTHIVKLEIRKEHKQNLNSSSGIANAVLEVVKHVQKHTKFIPRNNQILAVVTLLLEQKNGTGCLLEVATGEGKSTIVAMFAAILALQGTFVDVITSSEVLARRDEEEWQPFYKDLGLSSCAIPVPETLSCKNQEEADSLLRKKYQSNIVYGTTSEFAADILRHEFERRNIRGNRKFQVVIVDEVDSMTLDNGLQLTYLSHNTTSLRHIEQLLATIWCLLSSYHQIQDSSGNIVWATKPQYIHTAIAENMVDRTEDLVEKACTVLQEGISIGLFTRSDCDDIQKMYKDNETEELQEKIQSVMANITPENEVQLIECQDLANISFKFFKIGANNRAIPFRECFDDVSDDERNLVSVLLLEKGLACEIFTDQDLKNLAIDVVSKKIRYSDSTDITEPGKVNRHSSSHVPEKIC
ncbi:uncharacterized protein [Amphiura filiformis]|uniref:uncharacterized protein n=1 Tax=Amphiura filiformis TaxID=82378 RepID=UPI003B20F95F